MIQVLGLKDSHAHGHTQAVVSPESRSLGPYPLTVNPCAYRVVLKIMNRIGILLRDHVDVPLKDDTLAVLHSRSGFLTYYYISGLVPDSLKAKGLSEIVHVLHCKRLML